jgi:4-diphosphocytidyl-2-C-methyl-D-erythritol kinase
MTSRSSSPSIVVRAPAKVNLLLAVREKLPDGYHRIETIFQAISLWDEIRLRPAREIALTCDDPRLPASQDNLCYRAARLLHECAGAGRRLGARIDLHKGIPAQAGLGGGSSDAAATLIGLSRMWRLGLRRAQLAEIAAQLGADVPFFLWGGTAFGEGRGEVLTRLGSAPVLHLAVAWREPGVSTAWAYSRWRRGESRPSRPMLGALAAGSAEAVAAALRNDLEVVVLPDRPDIAELKQALLDGGALAALMAGSGSAVFGVFPNHIRAQETALALSKKGMWARAARSIRTGVCVSRLTGAPGKRRSG